MSKTFTWERGPFSECPMCGKETFGFLSAGGDRMTLRCSDCRYSERENLPKLNKKVIYLDQNILSYIFQVHSGGKLPLGHEDYFLELYEILRKLVLLQQIVIPHSDIHHSETIVFREAVALREAYEFLGGDISFVDSRTLELEQIGDAAEGFMKSEPVNFRLEPTDSLTRELNQWLDHLHITVKMDYGHFAEGIRAERERTHASMQGLVAQWAERSLSFEEMLKAEMNAFSTCRVEALQTAMERHSAASSDSAGLSSFAHSWIFLELDMLESIFRDGGATEEQIPETIRAFWNWQGNWQVPSVKISSYLFAALGRRVVAGQKKVTRGFMNDVRAISSYAPYVDAMFVDKECAALLSEAPLSSELNYRAEIHSLNEPIAFLDYLKVIEGNTPNDVREYAGRIYGI